MHFFAYEYDQVQHRLRQRASLALSEVTFYALQIFGGMGILSVSMWFRLDMVGLKRDSMSRKTFSLLIPGFLFSLFSRFLFFLLITDNLSNCLNGAQVFSV